MTATREHRNAGMVEDAIASIGTAITVAEHLVDAVHANLPDANDYEGAIDYETAARAGLNKLRVQHANLTAELGI